MTKGQQLKDNWLKALRSGEYVQNRGSLEQRGTYCCLGVYAKCNNIEITTNGMEIAGRGYNPLIEVLKQDYTTTLWLMNDAKKKTFAEIADYIEQNVEFKDDI